MDFLERITLKEIYSREIKQELQSMINEISRVLLVIDFAAKKSDEVIFSLLSITEMGKSG